MEWNNNFFAEQNAELETATYQSRDIYKKNHKKKQAREKTTSTLSSLFNTLSQTNCSNVEVKTLDLEGNVLT